MSSDSNLDNEKNEKENNKDDDKIAELKSVHSIEVNQLKKELDELKTNVAIIETTKQDELDEFKHRAKQEIDSLNHIINALQSDLNTIRADYEQLNINYKEYKRHTHHSQEIKSPQTPVLSSKLNTSSSTLHSQHYINQENENLEEDMRKAKESAEILRSVVLPLETEITTLRSRSNTLENRIKELEKMIESKEKEKQQILNEESKIINDCLKQSFESDIPSLTDNVYFSKYVKLKKYLNSSENKFIELEQKNLKAIKQIYSLLNKEQKFQLIPNRPKSRSINSNNSANKNENNEEIKEEQNETISKLEELVAYLTDNLIIKEDTESDSYKSSGFSNPKETTKATNINQINTTHTYAELMAMYEKEREYRINLENDFELKSKDANRIVENLNKEMSNLALVIEDLRKQYTHIQNQHQYQMDTLIRVNEQIRNDLKSLESKNSQYVKENMRLKAENIQFYGEQTRLYKELDEQFQIASSLDEANNQSKHLRSEIVKLLIANQAVNKQLSIANDKIKHLKQTNINYQESNSNVQDQLVITQSLESELERERKVRIEAEKEKQEALIQLKMVKDKSQSLVDSLRQRIEQNEFEIRKMRDENQELNNQIQSLKKESKNSLSVQEDLVKLIQSLQIELNQMKMQNDLGTASHIEVRCQSEDDFSDCASCKTTFTVTKRKHRCKHCCKVLCAECCNKTVLSGPNLRPHKVCEPCHTLLDKDSAKSAASI